MPQKRRRIALFLLCVSAFVVLFNIRISNRAILTFRYFAYIFGGAFVWTGYYNNAIQELTLGNNDPKAPYDLYAYLERNDKLVEIFEQHIVPEIIDKEEDNEEKKKTPTRINDFAYEMYFVESLEALSNRDRTEDARNYIDMVQPHTDVQQKMQQQLNAKLEQCQAMQDTQRQHIDLAIDLANSVSFGPLRHDPHAYYRYGTMASMVLLGLAVRSMRRSSRGCWALLWLLLPMALYYSSGLATSGRSLLSRVLTLDVPMSSLGKMVIGTVIEQQHSTDLVPLERARRIFLDTPFHCQDLLSGSAVSLVAQFLWRFYAKCRAERPKIYQKQHISPPRSCHDMHRAAYTFAAMIEMDHFEQGRFLYAHVENTLTSYMQDLPIRQQSNQLLSRSDRIRSMADDFTGIEKAGAGGADRGGGGGGDKATPSNEEHNDTCNENDDQKQNMRRDSLQQHES